MSGQIDVSWLAANVCKRDRKITLEGVDAIRLRNAFLIYVTLVD